MAERVDATAAARSASGAGASESLTPSLEAHAFNRNASVTHDATSRIDRMAEILSPLRGNENFLAAVPKARVAVHQPAPRDHSSSGRRLSESSRPGVSAS